MSTFPILVLQVDLLRFAEGFELAFFPSSFFEKVPALPAAGVEGQLPFFLLGPANF